MQRRQHDILMSWSAVSTHATRQEATRGNRPVAEGNTCSRKCRQRTAASTMRSSSQDSWRSSCGSPPAVSTASTPSSSLYARLPTVVVACHMRNAVQLLSQWTSQHVARPSIAGRNLEGVQCS